MRISAQLRLLTLLALLPLGAGIAPPADAQQAALKPTLHGLVAMGNIGFHRQDGGTPVNAFEDVFAEPPGTFDGVVVNVAWAQIEPRPGTFDMSSIDESLRTIRSYNQAHAQTPLHVRLRVWPGPTAPGWAKSLGGAPVSVLHKDMPITIGRFWSEEYRQAWRRVQDRLAARYDADPLIRSVSMSACSSITDEPFIVPGDPTSSSDLRAAGFDDEAERACLIGAIDDYAAWRSTRIELPVSPVRDFDNGRPRMDEAATLEVMTQWRRRLGAQLILSSHALDSPPRAGAAWVFENIRKLGPPMEFQTRAPRDIDLDATLHYGAALGATAIELWSRAGQNQGFTALPPQQLITWQGALRRNSSP